MYGIEIINAMNRAAGRKARPAPGRKGKQPFVAKTDGITLADCAEIPNFGDYRPAHWDLVATHFVDSSGFGSPGQPALTATEFCKLVKAGHGYAIVEQGQFQIYIGEFKHE